MRISQLFFGFTLMVALAPAAFCDDGEAAIGAGGIEFKKSDAISMEREDLFISEKKIRVRFEFKNNGKTDYRTIVAFPIPPIYADNQASRDAGQSTYGAEGVASSFRVQVNGKPIGFKKEAKAFAKDKDVSEVLNKYKIDWFDWDKAKVVINKLPKAVRNDFETIGIIKILRWTQEGEQQESTINGWEIREKYYWEQVFPTNSITVIEHEYDPATGLGQISKGDTSLLDKEFCIDKATAEGIKKIVKQYEAKITHPGDAIITFYTSVKYILTSARTWLGPIKNFHLVIDKPEGSVLSLCFDGLKKTGPLKFEANLSNFLPKDELNILFVQPPRK